MGICANKDNHKGKKHGKGSNPFSKKHKGFHENEHHEEVADQTAFEKLAGKVKKSAKKVGHAVEDAWHGLEHTVKFGKNHRYIHQDPEMMVHFQMVHLDTHELAQTYLEHHHHRVAHQEIIMNMDRNTGNSEIDKFAAALEHGYHIRKLKLSWWKNKSLNLKHFERFMHHVSKMDNLEKLEINLRWNHQVTDEWMKVMADTVPENVHTFTLWLYHCPNVGNEGLSHVMDTIGYWRDLRHVRLYLEGTGCDQTHRRELLGMFEKGFDHVRVEGLEL